MPKRPDLDLATLADSLKHVRYEPARQRARIRTRRGGEKIDRSAKTVDELLAIYRELFGDNAATPRADRSESVYAYVARWNQARAGGPDGIAENTRRTYDHLMRHYLQHSPLGELRLVDVNREDVEQHLAKLSRMTSQRTGRPLSRSTVAGVRGMLGSAFADARLIPNPARGLGGSFAPRKIDRTIAPPTDAEIALILDHLQRSGDRYEALYRLAVTTGLRVGELLGLRWSHVELGLHGQAPHVRVEMQRGDGQLRRLKTQRSRRVVDIGPETVASLRAWQLLQIEEKRRIGSCWQDRDGLVFTTKLGTGVDAARLRKHLRGEPARGALGVDELSGAAAMRKARGVESRLRWHDFRHAYATLALEAFDAQHVSKLLGHASIVTTVDTYGSLTAQTRRSVAEYLDRRVAPQRAADELVAAESH
jgi:integrase